MADIKDNHEIHNSTELRPNEAHLTHQRRPAHSPRSKIASMTFMSAIRSTIHTILTYTSLLIIAAFTLVQAMEAVSLVLGLHI